LLWGSSWAMVMRKERVGHTRGVEVRSKLGRGEKGSSRWIGQSAASAFRKEIATEGPRRARKKTSENEGTKIEGGRAQGGAKLRILTPTRKNVEHHTNYYSRCTGEEVAEKPVRGRMYNARVISKHLNKPDSNRENELSKLEKVRTDLMAKVGRSGCPS